MSILHEIILGRLLGLSRQEQDKGRNLKYVKGERAALTALDERDEHQAAFLLNPAPVSRIMEIAFSGIRLPQKSTYFYPKLLTGLVFRSMEDI